MPRVSVVIPCYNGQPYLAPAIASLQAQTFQDWNLIYVDDCSSDDSLKVARSYADHDSRIKVYQNPENLGMVGNWNRACGLASGDYVKLLCADDVIYPTCLSDQVALLDSHPNACMVTGGSSVINSKGKQIVTRNPAAEIGIHGSAEINAWRAFHESVKAAANLYGEPSVTLMRRSAMEQAGQFHADYKYGTDLEYWLRLAQRSKGTIVVSDKIFAGFRLHPGSLTNQGMSRGLTEMTRLFRDQGTALNYGDFNEESFAAKYRRQIKIKSLVINFAESNWVLPLFKTADRLRALRFKLS